MFHKKQAFSTALFSTAPPAATPDGCPLPDLD
jgi:hypothetical protein